MKMLYSEKDVLGRFESINKVTKIHIILFKAYKSKADKLLTEIKKRDKTISDLKEKNRLNEKTTFKMNQNLADLHLVERKMGNLETHYLKSIRKIFSHYCISLSRIVIEASKIKKLYERLTTVKLTSKKVQVILGLRYLNIY